MISNLAIWTEFSFDISVIRLILVDLSIINYIEIYREKTGPQKQFDISIKSTYPRSTYPRLTVFVFR